MREAIDAYRHITVSQEFKELDRIRQRALHDEANAVSNAERRGRHEGEATKAFEIARNLLRTSLPIDQIVLATGLTRNEVENLKQ